MDPEGSEMRKPALALVACLCLAGAAKAPALELETASDFVPSLSSRCRARAKEACRARSPD